ncbi:hypothetical protein Smp_178290 [Schistosoma mansoni]|uniref:hypothetical protein n=1 Tax=Schistosoma mansoni TaxID=6183 RepID=UPI0001A62001|nr:hypothetical protein Smp_178290 [Schistosoma mansoni]|eukprot:XP_018652838.1 hypothetical protein Smp_178290 [Schistosoma mansoni]
MIVYAPEIDFLRYSGLWHKIYGCGQLFILTPLNWTVFKINYPTTKFSTKFDVKSNIYNQVNDTPVEWIEEYSNTNSVGYSNLKSKYCDLLLYYLKQGENNAADGASCEKVTFTPVTSTKPDGTVVRTVQGDTVINVPTTTGTQLTGSQLYGLFINGYNKTGTSPSSIKLNALDVQRTTGTITCSQFTNPCGEHATCRDSPPGITCFCNSMWKDMNPDDPGKQCVLHPAAIALIALASLLLLAALILLLICLLRRRRRRNSSILASTDLATLNRMKQTKAWKSKLDKNKFQFDEDQSISIPRASVTGSPIGLSSIPASPVPLTGLPMPLTPVGSNMMGGLPPVAGTALPLTGSTLPLTAIRGGMPNNIIDGIQQIPASPAPLTGLPMPLTPVGSNMIGGLPQVVGSPIPPTGLPMPLAPMGSNIIGGLPQIVGT